MARSDFMKSTGASGVTWLVVFLHFFASLTPVTASPTNIAGLEERQSAVIQVNYYSDSNCENFIDAANFAQSDIGQCFPFAPSGANSAGIANCKAVSCTATFWSGHGCVITGQLIGVSNANAANSGGRGGCVAGSSFDYVNPSDYGLPGL